ncbi:MAG: tetratricopeptide repeat protein [Acidobacteria bacterium]|nr:MAG: tetratricopeptide repeat protein [Acidobacteriota bacterium]
MERARSIERIALPALVVAVACWAYAPALRGEFVWDDRPLILENETLDHPEQLARSFATGFWDTGEKNDRFRNFYRPLVTLSYAADRALWGRHPLGFHLTNLILHVACSLLVLAIALEEGLGPVPAAFGAALFAAHPVHVESVAWISGRTDLLCAVFAFAALASSGGRRLEKAGYRYGSAALLFAALLAKEMAITLPGLILIRRCLTVPEPSRLRRALALTMPHWAAAAAYLAIRATAVGVAPTALLPLTLPQFAATACFVLARYATLLLLPVGLDAHYPYGPVTPLSWSAALGGALVAAAGWWTVLLIRREPRTGFWCAFTIASFAPVLAFGSFGDVLMADRFAYIPSLGLAYLAARLAASVRAAARGRAGKAAAAAVAAALLLAAAGLSRARCRVWHDDLALFSDMVRTSPDSALVRANLGLAYMRAGRYPEAARELEAAVELVPDYAIAHNNLAAVYERQGNLTRALAHYQRALDIEPGQLESRINVGSLLVRLGDRERGLAILRAAAARHPRFEPAVAALAAALEEVGDEGTALALLARAEALRPEDPQVHYLRGKILFERGDLPGAAAAMRRFLELWPADDLHRAAAMSVIRRARLSGTVAAGAGGITRVPARQPRAAGRPP